MSMSGGQSNHTLIYSTPRSALTQVIFFGSYVYTCKMHLTANAAQVLNVVTEMFNHDFGIWEFEK